MDPLFKYAFASLWETTVDPENNCPLGLRSAEATTMLYATVRSVVSDYGQCVLPTAFSCSCGFDSTDMVIRNMPECYSELV